MLVHRTLRYGMTVALFATYCLTHMSPAESADTKTAKLPNIVFIVTDDQAPWALGASGYAQARTPNLDRLVHDGAYLPNAFTVTPVCSPARTSILTSRYGSECGITDWINPRTEPDLGLDPSTPAWPRLLAERGYSTALVGKWHLGTLDKFHPSQFGYEQFMGFRAGGTSPKDPRLEKGGEEQKFSGYTYDLLTDEAIDFIKKQADKPFLLSFHYRAPHAPWLPAPDEDWSQFKDLDPSIPNPDYPKLDIERLKKTTREYLASLAGVDRNFGRLRSALKELKLDSNTVIIFTSDHGYNMGHNGIWHKGNGHWILTDPPAATENIPRGQRPNMYDNSIRVPAIVCWPGVIKPGTVVRETVTHLDWFPTLVAVAGGELPEGAAVRGRNILPLLKGQNVDGWNNDLYAEYSTHHQSKTHMRMYRTPRWKLVRDFLNEGRDELYDLKDDPAETTNLINQDRPEVHKVVAELHDKIIEKMTSTGDPVLEKVPPAGTR